MRERWNLALICNDKAGIIKRGIKRVTALFDELHDHMGGKHLAVGGGFKLCVEGHGAFASPTLAKGLLPGDFAILNHHHHSAADAGAFHRGLNDRYAFTASLKGESRARANRLSGKESHHQGHQSGRFSHGNPLSCSSHETIGWK